MKTIKNKVTSIRKPTGVEQEIGNVLTYADLIAVVVSETPKEGFTLPEQRVRLKILAVLDTVKPTENISFEDADFITVQKATNDMRWNMLHKDLVDFGDTINSCK